MLITHRGLSGPAILQISSYWEKGQPIHVDLAPDREVAPAMRTAKFRNLSAAQNAFQGILPRRFAERWLDQHVPAPWNNEALPTWKNQTPTWQLNPPHTEDSHNTDAT